MYIVILSNRDAILTITSRIVFIPLVLHYTWNAHNEFNEFSCPAEEKKTLSPIEKMFEAM